MSAVFRPDALRRLSKSCSIYSIIDLSADSPLLMLPATCWCLSVGFSVSVHFVDCHTQSPPLFSLAKVMQAQFGKYHSRVVIDGLFSKSFGAGHKTFTLS